MKINLVRQILRNEAIDLWIEVQNKVFTELFNTEKRKKYPL